MSQFRDWRASDGSRKFAELPQTVLWYDLRDHLLSLPSLELTGFLTDHVIEAWIDFTFRDCSFTINDQFGEDWFFAENPACPDDVLEAVIAHCRPLLVREA